VVRGKAARAAVFDLDGTLVDSEQRSRVALQLMFTEYGVPFDDVLLQRFVGRRGPEVFAELAHLFPGHDPVHLASAVGAHFSAVAHPPVPALPGALELTAEIHRHGDPMALVTSAGRKHAVPTLERLGLLGMFTAIVTASDVAVGKPHPEGYLRASAELGIDPADCVVFEDSPAGLAAARTAGMYCVAVTTTHPPSELGLADRIVADLTEITWPVGRPAVT
jgi:mannitol-1-/sugar-/sorbitol-6-phosphatase